MLPGNSPTSVRLWRDTPDPRISTMKIRRSATLLVFASTTVVAVWGQNSQAYVRQIILSTRHVGAHGMGYNTRSLWQLSRKLTPADIPVLISLASGDSGLSVGAQFALASQCGPSVSAVRGAVEHKDPAQRRFLYLEAGDALQLISEFEGCTPEVRHQAVEVRAEVRRFIDEEHQRLQQESKQKADEDARIQKNSLKLLDPEQAKTPTREQRLEVYRRSLAAMGLKEDGPMTPEQRRLVDRMYRSMVLGEEQTPPNQ
jgi:alkanesulfonate monooxygenase SsuD/methylene tetrahydromethanopterin reductase-like flavin-dependent oxidoreductase (luciferase family)